jgi:predicted dehydrogenase
VPTIYHLQSSRPFLEAGIQVMLEKPIAPTYEESLQIIELADAANVILQIGHLERFNAGVMALSERIKKPRFIEAHRISGFVARATDVDVVTDLMIHDLDIVLCLAQSKIMHISAVGTPVLTNHVDMANVRLEFENGIVANLTASRVSEKKLRRIRVFEDHRYESLDFINQQIESVSAKPAADGEEWPEIIREKIIIEPRQPLDSELECFIRSVTTGAKPLVDGRVGLAALEVALQVQQKMQENSRLNLAAS